MANLEVTTGIPNVTADGSGNLNVNIAEGTISGGNAAAGLTGAAVPGSADYVGFNSGGNLVGVSAANPLPITGSISATNPSVGTPGAAAPASATMVGGTDGTDLRSLLTDATGQLKVLIENSPAVTITSGTVAVTESGAWNVNQTLGTPGFEAITDGTNGPAAVKAASTAAVATDKALVVAISPNNSITFSPSGTQTVAGAKTNNAAAPGATNVGALVAVANALGQTWTEGDQVLLSEDLNGSLRTMAGVLPETTAAWTSATTVNTALTATVTGYGTVIVTLNQGTTLTGGAVTFEVSDAATNWYSIPAQILNGGTGAFSSFFSFVASSNTAFSINVAGFVSFRIRLSTVISGTGTVNVGVQANAFTTPPSGLQAVNVITSSVAIKATVNAFLAADNLTTNNALDDLAATNARPLLVADEIFGGAFSGTANANLQGWSKMRTPTVYKTASVSAGTSGNSAVWTPGTGNKFRLLGFQITAQGLSATASASVTVSFQDATTGINIGTYDIDIPAVANLVTGVTQISGVVNLGAFGVLSAAANNALNFNLSAALTGATGTYRVTAWGTEE
jgi:hypothetical protein